MNGLSCDDCGVGRVLLDQLHQENVCDNCGIVSSGPMLDSFTPYRIDDGVLTGNGHAGPPQRLGSTISGSVISYGNRDANGTPLSNDPVARALACSD